jgi:hypothetical protein
VGRGLSGPENAPGAADTPYSLGIARVFESGGGVLAGADWRKTKVIIGDPENDRSWIYSLLRIATIECPQPA